MLGRITVNTSEAITAGLSDCKQHNTQNGKTAKG